MPRGTSYPVPDWQIRAQAGADTLNRMESNVADDIRYQDQRTRQIAQDARAEQRAVRSDAREDRMAKSQELDDEVKRSQFEKDKALDENAKLMKIQMEKDAIEANKALRAINTADEDASLKLAQWENDHFRVLHPKTGDPRIIQQYEINRDRVELARSAKEKLAAERVRAEAAKASGLVPSSVTAGGVTYSQPKEEKEKPAKRETFEEFNKELGEMVKAYGDSSKVPKEVWDTFEKRKAAITAGPAAGAAGPTGAPAAPAIANGTIVKNPTTGARMQFRDGQWQPL